MKSLTVAAIQTHPVFGRMEENVKVALDFIPDGCDLAVLPELFSTGYQFKNRNEALDLAENLTGDAEPRTATGRLTRAAAESGTTIVAGLAEKDGDRIFNSSVLFRPDGSREIYRKVHLFVDEKSIFTPGDLGFPVFEACGTTIGMMICFDWIFPEAARSLALAGAEIICHPSNLLLPWCQAAMITRCQENMVFAVTSNRVGSENRTGTTVIGISDTEMIGGELVFSGRSQIVDPQGNILSSLNATETGVAVATIQIEERDKQFTQRNNLFEDRRPELYRS
jgi:predicted amidohydrolase